MKYDAFWDESRVEYAVNTGASAWVSRDGLSWLRPDGSPIKSDLFAGAEIKLNGGPSDGATAIITAGVLVRNALAKKGRS